MREERITQKLQLIFSYIDTYISMKVFEGMKHIKSVEINNSCGTCVASPDTQLKKRKSNDFYPKEMYAIPFF